jgi:predicted RNA-binding Zn-ribbon protein involved in translation (DUF1610 family)
LFVGEKSPFHSKPSFPQVNECNRLFSTVRVGISQIHVNYLNPMRAHPEVTPWFIGIWIALAIVGIWVTYLDKNVPRKKRLIPVFIVGAGVIFVVFTLLMTGDWRAMALVVPVVALITFLNLHQFKVCSTCGRTIHSGMWFARAEYCPKCGGRLIGNAGSPNCR